MQKKRINRTSLFLVLLLIAGVCIVAYPKVSNYVNTSIHRRAIGDYNEIITNMDRDLYAKIFADAEAYNADIASGGFKWLMSEEEKADYESQLKVTDSSALGYIEIPKIKEKLVIYHGIDEETLTKGIGHIEGTSLPIGGKTSHCVLSGHRGLPSAELFTNLDKLLEGDIFMLNILDRTYTYEVDRIRIVNPDDMSKITLESGCDYVTLVTCTPYGVNTHRLLVRGHRIDNISGESPVTPDAVILESITVMFFIAVPVVAFIFILIVLLSNKRIRYNKLKGKFGL